MIQDLDRVSAACFLAICREIKEILVEVKWLQSQGGDAVAQKEIQRRDSSCSRIINRTVRLDSAEEWGHHEGAKFSPNKEARLQRLPKQAFKRGKKKKKKERWERRRLQKKKKWAFSFNPKLLSGKKAKSSVPEREIKSKLSPHKEPFPVKGMKIVYCSTENENRFQTLG